MSLVRGDGGITWRSVLIGLTLAAALSGITPYNDFFVANTFIAGNHFPTGAVAALVILSLANFVLHRWRKRPLLRRGELAVIYVLVMVSSGIASSGVLRYWIPSLTTPYYYASEGNRWEALFWNHIPTWLAVSRGEAVKWFWEGMPDGALVPWGDWIVPVSRWFLLIAAVWGMMICLAALVRKQWADRERLTFPLVQFPLDVVRGGDDPSSTGFFTNRLVWAGMAVVFLVNLINGLSKHFPSLPAIPMFWDFNPNLVDRPWDGAIPLFIAIFPAVIGFGYLLSLEVAAGFWGAFLFMKAQGIFLSAVGYAQGGWGGPIAEFANQEQMGGLVVLAVILLWFLRGTFAEAFRSFFVRAAPTADRAEPLSYRAAALGLLISVGVAFAWLLEAGMTWPAAAIVLLSFLAICLVLTRIVAEAGLLMVQLSYGPSDYLLLFGGTAAAGAPNLTIVTFVECSLMFDLREFLMPSILNGFRLCELSGVPPRKAVPPIIIALLICFAVSLPMSLLLMYHQGAAQLPTGLGHDLYTFHPPRFFARLASQLESPQPSSGISYLAMAIGGGLVAALAWLRINFVWWPIHPLGFVMGTSWATLNLWFSMFLGWVFKALTIRYTGLRGYVQFRPFFMGVILGDVLGALLWIIVGFFTKVGITVTLY